MIHIITEGQQSDKSKYGEQSTLQLNKTPAYSNVMEDFNYDVELSYKFISNQWRLVCENNNMVIAITNRNRIRRCFYGKSTRAFVDLHGKENQHITQLVTKVYFMVSGIPMHIKI